MDILRSVLIGIVILEHLYFFYLESFAWTTRGPKVFGRREGDFYNLTKSMASNQGVYNGFLAAGLVWGFLINEYPWKLYIWIFFLSCIIIAGIWGAVTVSRKIFVVQSIPALIALIVLHL
ncbi:MAG: DUF1304 domain-containing protein [Bacteroidota bacterium]